jgi:hypothetical protein
MSVFVDSKKVKIEARLGYPVYAGPLDNWDQTQRQVVIEINGITVWRSEETKPNAALYTHGQYGDAEAERFVDDEVAKFAQRLGALLQPERTES